MRINFTKIFVMFFAGLVIILAYWVIALNKETYHDTQLEIRVNSLLFSLKENSNEYTVDLSTLVAKPLRKVCIQSPYDTPDRIESVFGEKVPEYSLLMEDRYVWWFFYQDGTVSQISVPVHTTMSFVFNPTVFCTRGRDAMKIFIWKTPVSGEHVYSFKE